MQQRRVPYGVSDYEKIIHGNYYFVDKTAFIRTLETWEVPIFLRPRRFGKSLFCSMLACYYDYAKADRFQELFGTTDIGRNPTGEQNSYSVLSFNFSDVESGGTIDSIKQSFYATCHKACVFYLLAHPEVELNPETLPESPVEALNSIVFATMKAKLPPLYIIIDEYDNFTNTLLTTGADSQYQQVTTGDSFLRTFYKSIKGFVGINAVGRIFITGILPITLDDMSSGFNIGNVITLDPDVHHMLGFTHDEMRHYLDEICTDHQLDDEMQKRVWDDLVTYYDGYRFLPDDSEGMFNSTICNYYLQYLTRKHEPPPNKYDMNLRLDVHWLKVLGGSTKAVCDFLQTILLDEQIPFGESNLDYRFNADMFIGSKFLPAALFYLGQLTWKHKHCLGIPNQNIRLLLFEHLANLMNFPVPEDEMLTACMKFQQERDMEALFDSFWKNYIELLPAQVFDKANENLFRVCFFFVCNRYFDKDEIEVTVETNIHTGRLDLCLKGIPGTPYADMLVPVEFKHFTREAASKYSIMKAEEPMSDDAEQLRAYARELSSWHPERKVTPYLVYTVSGQSYRLYAIK